MTERTCLDCKFHVSVDFGYSNYTVEGTTFNCAKQAHPDGDFDQFYGQEKKLKFAQECAQFEEGEGVDMDVDQMNEPDLTPAQREVYEMYQRS